MVFFFELSNSLKLFKKSQLCFWFKKKNPNDNPPSDVDKIIKYLRITSNLIGSDA